MPATWWPGRILEQLRGVNPFGGDSLPSRVPVFASGRPTLPFPHPWNYREPIRIFETFWCGAEKETGAGRHNRYLYVGGFPPVLLSRDPAIIKAVLGATGEKPGQFDRDTAPTAGIARATGRTPCFTRTARSGGDRKASRRSRSAGRACSSRSSSTASSRRSGGRWRSGLRFCVRGSGRPGRR